MTTSVALCSYNGVSYIREQLDSILNQSTKVDEIIICDDGSIDGTIEIIEHYASTHSIISLHKNKTRLGFVKNFEKAINLCTKEIIFLSDQDDIWHLNKVEKYILIFHQNPNIKCIALNLELIDSENKSLNKSFFEEISNGKLNNINQIDLIEYLIENDNFIPGASMAFKRKDLNLNFQQNCIFAHDGQIILYFISKKAFKVIIEESYTKYRIHDNQQIGLRKKNNLSIQDKMNHSFEVLKRMQYINKFVSLSDFYKQEKYNNFYTDKEAYLNSFGYFSKTLR